MHTMSETFCSYIFILFLIKWLSKINFVDLFFDGTIAIVVY